MLNFINTILDLGASVVMPIIITIVGLIFGMKPVKAIRAGLTVGVGFIGINLVTGTMGGYLTPIIEGLQSKFNIALDVYDMGWPVSSGIAFSTGTFVVAMFALLIVINVILLILNLTSTLNVDLWNYWHFIMGGSLAYALTGSFLVGCIVGGVYGGVVLLLCDKHEKVVEEYLGYPGVSITTQSFPLSMYLCLGLDWILDHIPGIKNIKFSLKEIKPEFSFLVEPIFLGFILGLVLSLVCGVNWQASLSAGVGMAAVMFILPRMVKILMEGLSPISNAAQEFLSKKFPGRHLNIGMDMAVVLGDRDIITMATIMVPVTILLAMVLPFNKMLPFTDLAAMTYFMVAPVMAGKRNAFRTIIIAIIYISFQLFVATDLAPLFTSVALKSGIIDASAGTVSALSGGGELIAWIQVKLIQIFKSIF